MTRTHENSLRDATLLTRIALAIPTVLILLTMVFLLMRVAPGNPIQAALGGHALPGADPGAGARAGYDRPILEQYVEYLEGRVHAQPRDVPHRQPPVTSIIVDNGAATSS